MDLRVCPFFSGTHEAIAKGLNKHQLDTDNVVVHFARPSSDEDEQPKSVIHAPQSFELFVSIDDPFSSCPRTLKRELACSKIAPIGSPFYPDSIATIGYHRLLVRARRTGTSAKGCRIHSSSNCVLRVMPRARFLLRPSPQRYPRPEIGPRLPVRKPDRRRRRRRINRIMRDPSSSHIPAAWKVIGGFHREQTNQC